MPTEHAQLFQRISESFARQQLMSLLGARLLAVTPGEVQIELPFRQELTQQHGYLHAAAITGIADSASGYSALSTMPEGFAVLSVEFKINLLAPAIGDSFIATGKVIRAGRTLVVTHAEVVAITGDVRKPVAIMQGTMMRIDAGTGRSG